MNGKLLSSMSAAVLLVGCGGEQARRTEAAAPAPIPVQTVAAATGPWVSTYEASGTVRARSAAVISSKVMGYVRAVAVQIGQRVSEGELLVTLDARDLEANYRRAEAAREEAAAAQPEVENAIAAARANLDLARVTFRRMQDLFDKKSISNQEYDEAAAKLKAAEANHAMALARRSQLQSRISQAAEEVRAAGIVRGYARIAAPFSGIVTEKQVESGNLATPGTPLLTVERAGSYRLEAAVEESRLGSIRVGQTASVVLDAFDRTLTARVSEVAPAVDASSRAYLVKMDLPSSPQLRPGLFGRVSFPMGSRQVVSIPAGAALDRGQLQSVMAVEKGVARTRLVTLGQTNQGRVEVLSGLNAGEQVIYPPVPGVVDGAKVEVRP